MDRADTPPQDAFWARLIEMVETYGDTPPLAAVHIMAEDQPRRMYVMVISEQHIELAPPTVIRERDAEGLFIDVKEGSPDLSLTGRVLLRRDEVRGLEWVKRKVTHEFA